MKRYAFVPRPNKVLNNVRSRGVSTAIAKPFSGFNTFHHTGLIRQATIGACILWKIDFNISFVIIIRINTFQFISEIASFKG